MWQCGKFDSYSSRSTRIPTTHPQHTHTHNTPTQCVEYTDACCQQLAATELAATPEIELWWWLGTASHSEAIGGRHGIASGAVKARLVCSASTQRHASTGGQW